MNKKFIIILKNKNCKLNSLIILFILYLFYKNIMTTYIINDYQIYIKSNIVKIVSEDCRTFQIELDNSQEIFSNKDIIIEESSNKLIINIGSRKIYIPEIINDFDFGDIQINSLKKIINDMNKTMLLMNDKIKELENDKKIIKLESTIEEIKKENELLKSYLGNNIFLHGSRMGINKFTLRLTLYISNYSFKKEEHISPSSSDWGHRYPINEPGRVSGIPENINNIHKKIAEYNIFYDRLIPSMKPSNNSETCNIEYDNINIRHCNIEASKFHMPNLPLELSNITLFNINNRIIPDLMYDEQYYHNVCNRDISNIKYLKNLKYLHLIKRGYISCKKNNNSRYFYNYQPTNTKVKNDWHIINFEIINTLENLEALVLEDIDDTIDITILLKLTKLKFLKIIDCDNIINSDRFKDFVNLELLLLENTNIKTLPKTKFMMKIDNDYYN